MSEVVPAVDTGLLDELTALASRAAAAILAVSRDKLAVRSKSDQSPVTAADEAALGDFTIKVTGHPTKGADASNEFKITVDKK